MSYCRYCGCEITYTKTVNDKWLPYDVTGQPHFHNNEDIKAQTKSGLIVCKNCGKPVFKNKGTFIDYTSLKPHTCNIRDITNYTRYLKRKDARKSN